MPEKYDKAYFDAASTKNFQQLRRYVDFLGSAGVKKHGLSICDIGCAEGAFISLLSKENDCYGIDISKHAIQQCKQAFPETKDNFFLCDLNKEQCTINAEFDLIAMLDVLEHLDNFAFLKNFINEKLKPGGYFLITTPNANSLLRVRKKAFSGEIDKTHTLLFTPYTLDFWLRKAGLHKVKLVTPYSFYFKANAITSALPFGGQILALYQKGDDRAD